MRFPASLCVLFMTIILSSVIAEPASATESEYISADNSIIFLFDASNSMNVNDRSRLAIDSIAQLIYSLPSNYSVGVVAYNTDVVAASGMADSVGRDSVMESANAVHYTGYTNTGVGLARAMGLLDTVGASQ